MKICLINNLYKPFSRGGAERIVELTARGLINNGHEVFIITTKPFLAKIKKASQDIKIYHLAGCYYYLHKIPYSLRLFWHVLDMFDWGSYFQIKSILKKEKPGIVMTHNLKGIGYLVPLAIKRLGICHIHTLHDLQLVTPSGLMFYGREAMINNCPSRIYAWICQLLFRPVNLVISPSGWLLEEHTKRKFFQNAVKKIILNPAALDKKSVGGSERKSIAPAKVNFRFLYLGQLEEHKGVIFLIKAFRKIKNNRSELLVAGAGGASGQVKRLAVNNKKITWLGLKSPAAVKEIMQGADCLIVPSLCYENSPTVIYEAFSEGLPVMAASLGGIPELIHKFGGVLFRPGDSDDLIKELSWAIKNPARLVSIGQQAQVEYYRRQGDYFEQILGV